MNVTTDATHWCDICQKYLSTDRPAVELTGDMIWFLVCLDCLRAAVKACEKKPEDRVVRGS